MSPGGAPGRIGDLIEVPQVQTVVRLDEGKSSPEEIAASFVFTSEVSAHFRVIADALGAGKGQGYFLQGDFGSGKSHLLAAMYTWLSGGEGSELLSAGQEGLKQAVAANRVLPVAVSLIDYRSGTPLERILLESIERALAEAGREVSLTPLSAFLVQLKNLLKDPETAAAFSALIAELETDLPEKAASGATEKPESVAGDVSVQDPFVWISGHPRQAYTLGLSLVKQLGLEEPQALVEERKESFQRVYRELVAAGFDGLFLLIDELSEFFRSKPTVQSLNEDARTLQFLGELTADHPLWILAAVQESIERTGDIAQSILRKIKDRFPIKLALSTVHIRSLISERLVRKKPGADEEIYGIYEHYRRQFPGFSCSFDEFRDTYPVHPATIALLDGLGDLFSQHRGIVDFVYARLAGDSRRDIPSILDRPQQELLGPDSIYEHFSGRLAEFSAYNIYPRHIVPHLDGEIDRIFDNGEDRHITRRLVRMLVLYRIHPTADSPTAVKLAELAACSLDLPEMNARFVAEALLDPLTAGSRFLRRRSPAATEQTGDGPSGWDPAQAVYEISSEEDSGKVLEDRLQRLAEEIPVQDSRLLLEPLFQLPSSDSWPGPALSREGAVREITWNLSPRRVLVRLVHSQDLPPSGLDLELEARSCDFALLLSLGELEPADEHICVWRIPLPAQGQALDTLREYLAVRLLQEQLTASNPADAPLIPLAADRLNRLRPAAAQAALDAFYSGSFSDPGIRVDAAVRQLRRFDSLLETAGRLALERRYPRFVEVAPRRYQPSPRIYQQLLETFIIPGSLSLSEARPLSAAIDGLAVPLGLVELKRGSYVFSPDISGHPLLIFFFELLRPSATVVLQEVLEELQRQIFGLPKDTALFLIASLAAGGLISVRRGGRTVALEYLSLQNLERAEEIALGELIGEHDRSTLIEECTFLSSTDEFGSFGLRQQRDTWKEVISFRTTAERLAEDTLSRLAQRRDYASFNGFRFSALEEKLNALNNLTGEIKVSYPAKEGLEKFLLAWRASGLDGDAIQFLRKLDRFFKREAEKFVFVHHYLRHEAAEKAAWVEPGLEDLRRRLLELLENPEELVVPDEGTELSRLFDAFRERYVSLYARLHGEFHESSAPPALSKPAERALEGLKRLSGIEALDRPPGLDRFLIGLNAARGTVCRRQVQEELMRSPVCGCGYLPGQTAPEAGRENPAAEIDRYLGEYLGILKTPGVLEVLDGHAYAIQDLKPQTAVHLKELAAGLQSGSLSAPSLLGALDKTTADELTGALSGTVSLRRVNLADLTGHLAGRRLPAERILALVSEWLGKGRPGELVAVEGAGGAPEAAGGSEPAAGGLEWWALANADLVADLSLSAEELRRRAGKLEEQLEKRFPAGGLTESLRRLETADLVRYICSEPLHTHAVQQAWRILARRVLGGDPGVLPGGPEIRSSHLDPGRAAEIDKHLSLAEGIARVRMLAFPERLSLRLVLEKLTADPWTGEDLCNRAAESHGEIASLGESWLEGLDPVEVIDLEQRPLVLLMDGASPDIWLEGLDLIRAFPEGLEISWNRLESEPETVAATAALFGLEGDPTDALAARNIPYLQISGREDRDLAGVLETFTDDTAALVRMGTLDRGAHQGTFKLTDMAAVLHHILEKELPTLQSFCRDRSRPLILTADHGLSIGSRGLGHGSGGVYERAIFRASWVF